MRHIARRCPGDLTRVFVPEGRPVEVLGWIDTQVTKLERRLDKALRLRVGAELRVLHVEFCFAWRDDVPDQMFEYLGFLFAALRREALGGPVPPIESVAVVLSGRRQRLPRQGRAAPPGESGSSAARASASTQFTSALSPSSRARGSVFWLVFAPLARDATTTGMREVVGEIHARVATGEERVELYTALLVMAAIDPWGHNLRKEIVMLMDDRETEKDLLWTVPWMREALDERVREAEQQAIAQLLGRLFARRVGRRPTAEEERSIVERAQATGLGDFDDALLDLDGDALVRWLAEPIRR